MFARQPLVGPQSLATLDRRTCGNRLFYVPAVTRKPRDINRLCVLNPVGFNPSSGDNSPDTSGSDTFSDTAGCRLCDRVVSLKPGGELHTTLKGHGRGRYTFDHSIILNFNVSDTDALRRGRKQLFYTPVTRFDAP